MRLSISFLLVVFSCYLALTFSQSMKFVPSEPCPKGGRPCTKDHRPYCVKNADGTLQQRFGGSSCPPCGKNISYFRGYCNGVAMY